MLIGAEQSNPTSGITKSKILNSEREVRIFNLLAPNPFYDFTFNHGRVSTNDWVSYMLHMHSCLARLNLKLKPLSCTCEFWV